MLSFLVFVLLPIVSVAAESRSYTLNIVNANVNPDGFVRSAVTVDGHPPPLLSANAHDDLRITVNNGLTDGRLSKSTSIVSEITPFWYPSSFGYKALARNLPT